VLQAGCMPCFRLSDLTDPESRDCVLSENYTEKWVIFKKHMWNV